MLHAALRLRAAVHTPLTTSHPQVGTSAGQAGLLFPREQAQEGSPLVVLSRHPVRRHRGIGVASGGIGVASVGIGV